MPSSVNPIGIEVTYPFAVPLMPKRQSFDTISYLCDDELLIMQPPPVQRQKAFGKNLRLTCINEIDTYDEYGWIDAFVNSVQVSDVNQDAIPNC